MCRPSHLLCASLLHPHIGLLPPTTPLFQKKVLAATRLLTNGVAAVKVLLPAFRTCAPPTGAEEQVKLLAPVAAQLGAAGDLGSGPRSPYDSHFKVVAEAAQALAWVAYTGPETGARAACDGGDAARAVAGTRGGL